MRPVSRRNRAKRTGQGRKGGAAGNRRSLPLRLPFWPAAQPKRKVASKARSRAARPARPGVWESMLRAGENIWNSTAPAAAFLALSLFYAALSGGHLASIGSGASALVSGVVGATGLAVKEITVRGRERARMDEILAALGVARGDSIASFNAESARRRIEQIGWVSAASVQRLLPDRIHIVIKERQPYAVWQSDGGFAVIDRTGTRLTGLDPARFVHLPRVVGEGAAASAEPLLRAIGGREELAGLVTAAVRVADRRWNLRMINGVTVMLPEGNVAPALNELVRLEAEHGILGRGITSIDFRLADRMTIRLDRETAERRRKSLESTAGGGRSNS